MNVTNGIHVSLPHLQNNQPSKSMQSGSALPTSRPQRDLLEISDTGKQLDLIHKDLVKVTLPSSPKDDVNEIMKMFRPETYEKMNRSFEQGNAKEGLNQLLSFAKELKNHSEWIQAYKEARTDKHE